MEKYFIKKYSVSVRELAEFTSMSGSIDNRYVGRGRALEGTALHKFIQKRYGGDDVAELTVKTTVTSEDGIVLNVGGRIDGILNITTDPTIEEIKSTTKELEDIEAPAQVHLAQCEIYAYIYAMTHELYEIGMRVTYIQTASRETRSFDLRASLPELKVFFERTVSEYFSYLRFRMRIEAERDASIFELQFPFEYRPYQKDIIRSLRQVIEERKNIYINAPTGAGKTLNALYPSIQALPELDNGKIFYLTSKSTQKNVAVNALDILRRKSGLSIKSLVITSKEKSCMLDRPSCNPEDCIYARDYYEKIKGLRENILEENDTITQEVIMKYAEEYKVCPFELGLDLANMCDIVICDYNYVFDPSSSLKRFFDSDAKNDYIFLVDEAHNLVDRSREMYSAVLDRNVIMKLKRIFKGKSKVYNRLDNINKILLSYSHMLNEQGVYISRAIDAELIAELLFFQFEADRYLSQADRRTEGYNDLLDFYFDAISFVGIAELMTDAHMVYFDPEENFLKIFCTDARDFLRVCIQKSRSSIFFSATLTPLDYYCELLGGNRNDYTMNIKSIFPQDNFKIAIDRSIQTTYEKRSMYYGACADRIHRTIEHEKGNYIVYFPSYAFMNAVYMVYCDRYDSEGIMVQQRNMTETDREEFLSNFTDYSHVCAFAVSGGVFAEAIDLTGDRLIGCIICGVSLPMICTERELINRHYTEQGKNGFDYAYVYPAMNKVLQAMGRVIRTVDDKGCAVLLDNRFTYQSYRKCFPAQYSNAVVINGGEQLDAFFDYEGDWGAG